MNTIQDRVKAVIEFLGVTQTAFSEIIGTHQSVLSRALKEDQTFGDALVNKIVLAFSDINKEWLLTGKGNMIKSEPSSNTAVNAGTIYGINQNVGSNFTSDPTASHVEVEKLKKEIEDLKKEIEYQKESIKDKNEIIRMYKEREQNKV